VCILKELLRNDDISKGPTTRFLFLHKFRELIKGNVNDNDVVTAQQCSLPVLLALFHRFVSTLRDMFKEKHVATEDSMCFIFQSCFFSFKCDHNCGNVVGVSTCKSKSV